MKIVDMTGATINGVEVMSMIGSSKGKMVWNCKCKCGATFHAVGTSLRTGKTKSCRICTKAKTASAATKHGFTGTREYNSYNAMMSRCYKISDKRFDRYGGRGIKVCDRWRDSFSNFIADMGIQPSRKHSIERIDRNGDYEPSNCVWATTIEQANNRSNNTLIDINGCTKTITQWSRESGINRTVILRRMKRGISGEQLIYKGIIR